MTDSFGKSNYKYGENNLLNDVGKIIGGAVDTYTKGRKKMLDHHSKNEQNALQAAMDTHLAIQARMIDREHFVASTGDLSKMFKGGKAFTFGSGEHNVSGTLNSPTRTKSTAGTGGNKGGTPVPPAATPATPAATPSAGGSRGKKVGQVVGAAAGALVPGAGETGASEAAGAAIGGAIGEHVGNAISAAVKGQRTKAANAFVKAHTDFYGAGMTRQTHPDQYKAMKTLHDKAKMLHADDPQGFKQATGFRSINAPLKTA